jgi:PAP2 superfamily
VSVADETAARSGLRLPGGRRLRDGRHLYWWLEIVAIVAFYMVYSAIRNANEGSYPDAFANARVLIDWQQALGINHEEVLQDWALHFRPVVIAMNYFYGSMHFVVTGGVGIYLYRRWSDDYPLWRNTLGIATAVALVGFITWPLCPPRLLPESYGFVDTLAKYPTIWSFNSGAVSKISNQYAAMPSVHCAWALWCACAMVPRVRQSIAKAAFALYPVMTVIAIVLTGNHFVLDAAGGFAIFGLGYVIARSVTRAGRSGAPAGATAPRPSRAPGIPAAE